MITSLYVVKGDLKLVIFLSYLLLGLMEHSAKRYIVKFTGFFLNKQIRLVLRLFLKKC